VRGTSPPTNSARRSVGTPSSWASSSPGTRGMTTRIFPAATSTAPAGRPSWSGRSMKL